jgi:hypothetical protein
LILINPAKKRTPGKVITSSFFSACSPNVSFDGKSLVFAAQKKEGDNWQIWKMNLKSLKTIQVTNSAENCIDPAWLPDERIVFSHHIQQDSLKAEHSLFTCNADGSDLKRITFNPHTYFASSVLKDGRIITISRQLFPVLTEPVIMVLRPDGTKSELFYKGKPGNKIVGPGRETCNGKIVFIETGNSLSGAGSLVSISYNRPLHSQKMMSSPGTENFNSVFPDCSGKLYVTCKTSENNHFALYEYNAEKMAVGKAVYTSDENILEAVVIQKQERPRKLPSEVDFGVKTGLLLCQNINLSGMKSPEAAFSVHTANQIEVLGINTSMGMAQVEKDGSVYMKIAADMPFRIQTLDSLGNVVNGPGGWYYLRPNERRGCVGCHEDNEITPANRYASAVNKNPVVFPSHIAGVIEKEVELE